MTRRTQLCGAMAVLLCCVRGQAQVIQFESNGLQYSTLTKGGVTVMFAHLPSHVHSYSMIQAAVSNGSQVSWTIRPEEFRYRRADGMVLSAEAALAVVRSFLSHASRRDVIKLVSTYEASVYGNSRLQSTNGYELRRQSALAEVSSAKLKAAAAASAIQFVPIRLNPGESTDGAVFFPNEGRPLGPGTLMLHAAGEDFEFPSDGESLVHP